MNRTHPDTQKVIQPHRGFDINEAHKIIAEIEHRQGWASQMNARYRVNEQGHVVKNLQRREQMKPKPKAEDFENATGEKSTMRIVQERAHAVIQNASCWEELHAGLDTVGIRMPSHPVARAVIEQSGCAFAAPSANLSGKPSPTNAQDVFTDMDGRLPLILDGGECDVGVESTVVSVVGDKPTLFRPGHITLEDLERALGEEVEVSKAILEKLPEGAVVRSPGMKYKHYAPKADVTLLNGTFEQFKAYVDAHMDQNPSCLCFTGEAEKLGVPCVEYGREGDGADQAKHIFRSLRALDEQGDGIVYARCPQKDGLSMAVYNRLIRAAAFRVIDL